MQNLPREPIPQTYLSAYALRINSCSNILGMAKFNGYFYTPNTVYIIYHLGSKLSGFYPNTESDIFVRHTRSIGNLPDLTRVPFMDANGNGIHLGERKIYA